MLVPRTFRAAASIAACLALAGLAGAQPTLTASGAVSPPTVTLTVTGAAPAAHVMLAASLQTGTSSLHGLTLGIALPWLFVYMGTTDASGQLLQTYGLSPNGLPSPLAGTTVYVQGGVITMGTGGMSPGGGGMGGGMMPGSGMTPGGGMGGGTTPGGGMGGGTMPGGGMGGGPMPGGQGYQMTACGMTITLTNLANFTF